MLIPSVAGVAPGGLGVALGAQNSGEAQAELDAVDKRLDDARGTLESVEGRRNVTLADLVEIDVRRAQLDARMLEVNGELGRAQAVLDEAEAQLAQSAEALGAAERKLAATQARLERNRERFQGRVRASFKYGGPGRYALAVLGADDIAEVGRTYKYVRTVMEADREQMILVAGLEREVTAQTKDLTALTREREAQRQVAAAERDRVAVLADEQRSVRAQVAAEAERHRLTLAQLESDRASYRVLVASLEAESDQLAAELRRMHEEDRRRAEAEQRAGRTAARQEAPAGKLARPSNGPITSRYGYREHPVFGGQRFHAGIDFGAPSGSPVRSGEAGRVVSAGWRGGYGNAIVIDHGGGLATLYAHLSSIGVSSGQQVSRGQTIGAVGSTGYSTGPHLHFEVRVDGEPRDPMPYL